MGGEKSVPYQQQGRRQRAPKPDDDGEHDGTLQRWGGHTLGLR